MDTTKIVNKIMYGNVELPIAGGGTGVEVDPTVPEWVKNISEQDIVNWNREADLSNYYTKSETEDYVQEQIKDLASKDYIDSLVGNINTELENVLGV